MSEEPENDFENPILQNTWQMSKILRDREIPEKDPLELAWRVLSEDEKMSHCRWYLQEIGYAPSQNHSTPLEAFLDYIIHGLYPPPHVIRTVAECFEEYFRAVGEKELEEIFFGSRIRGKGNYSARSKYGHEYIIFDHMIHEQACFSELKGEKVPPVIVIAERCIELYPHFSSGDPENLVRGWQRWKKRTGRVAKGDTQPL